MHMWLCWRQWCENILLLFSCSKRYFNQVVAGELTIVTGVPNSGKSEWIDALMCNLNESFGWKFALCSMENKVNHFVVKLGLLRYFLYGAIMIFVYVCINLWKLFSSGIYSVHLVVKTLQVKSLSLSLSHDWDIFFLELLAGNNPLILPNFLFSLSRFKFSFHFFFLLSFSGIEVF